MVNHIKIHGVKPRIQYVANGNLKKYEFPFAIFKTSDVDVYLDDKLLTISEYEVSIEPDIEGGAISFKVAPSNGTVITIARNLSIERTTDFQEGGALRANVLNDELDYQIACQQQIADSLNRSMVLPPYAVNRDVDLTLPTPSAGKAIVWNADGTNLENSTVEVNALESTLNGYKTAAESAASTATEKANIASDKADIATTQAGIATQKAEEATSTLSTKANKDMDNLSDTGKTAIITLGMPDYSAGVDISVSLGTQHNQFIAPCDCFVTIATGGTGSTAGVAIIYQSDNQTAITRNDNGASGSKIAGCSVFLNKGDEVYLGLVGGSVNLARYYPLKGVQNA